jgi:exopolysaccharide biosynthesis polyprenyl glycosylphosphotransferase
VEFCGLPVQEQKINVKDMSSYYSKNEKSSLWRLKTSERRTILLVGDIIAACLAVVIAVLAWSYQDQWLNLSIEFFTDRIPNWFYLLPIVWMVLMIELYDMQKAGDRGEVLKGIGIAAGIAFIIYLVAYFSADPKTLPRVGVAVYIISVALFTFLWRMLFISIFTTPLFLRRVLVVGAGRQGETIAEVTSQMWPKPFYLVGFVDDDPEKVGTKLFDFPVIGNSKQLLQIIHEHEISDIIFAISGQMKSDLYQDVLKAEEIGIHVTSMPKTYEDLLGRVPIELLPSDWIIRSFVDQAHTSSFYELAKRLLDIFGGIVGCFFMLLLLPFVTLANLLETGFPIFYKQERLGKNGRPFYMYKFRTMRTDAEKDGKAVMAIKNDSRATKVGKFLRKSHIDEFPQFINVLRGDMSLVGPRAERDQLVRKIQEEVPFYRARLLTKPGLTGWAQVNYGYASNIRDTAIKLEYDLYYIKHQNILLDINIILRTVGTVFGLRGQ